MLSTGEAAHVGAAVVLVTRTLEASLEEAAADAVLASMVALHVTSKPPRT